MKKIALSNGQIAIVDTTKVEDTELKRHHTRQSQIRRKGVVVLAWVATETELADVERDLTPVVLDYQDRPACAAFANEHLAKYGRQWFEEMLSDLRGGTKGGFLPSLAAEELGAKLAAGLPAGELRRWIEAQGARLAR